MLINDYTYKNVNIQPQLLHLLNILGTMDKSDMDLPPGDMFFYSFQSCWFFNLYHPSQTFYLNITF